jgi:hypothetical protein
MYRLAACLGCLFAAPTLAFAQGIVIAGYAPPVVYAPAYYAPPVTTYYAPAPVVASYYAAPAVSYYGGPGVVTTYRYPLFRPRAVVVRSYPY